MEDLIKALQIFSKYANYTFPTFCSDDILYINDIHRCDMRREDIKEVTKLGFMWSRSDRCFISFRFGSC